MVNIVTIESQRYLVDVGFGTSGPTFPTPLIPDYTAVNIAPQAIRLLHMPVAEFSNQSILMWCYQYCNKPDDNDPVWIPAYCFCEMEWLPPDFAVINHYITTHPSSFWLRVIVAMNKIMDDREMIVGEVSLVGTSIKRRVAGKSQVLATSESEKQRTEALKEYLGITLTTPEQNGIFGLQTALA